MLTPTRALSHRYDPEISISDEISTESDRVLFLKSTAKIMLSKARVKLNLKRLYAADGYAVRELLKIANMLRDATTKAEGREDAVAVESLDLDRKNLDPKQVREHATDITRCGAFLYDVLQNEIQSRDLRYRAVNSNIDLEEIERAVQNSIQSVKENITNLDIQLDELEKDKTNLESQGRRAYSARRAELERSEKRLSTLQSVRPAYMDEYEQLQAKMQDLYTKYLERHRNLEYLESQLELHRSTEQRQIDAASKKIRKMQRRLQDEEMRILRGEVAIDDEDDAEDDEITDMTDESGFLSPGQSTLPTRRRSIVATELPDNLVSSAEKTVQGSLAMNDEDEDSEDFSDLTEASEDSDTHLSVNDEELASEELEGLDEDDTAILTGDEFSSEGSDMF